MAIIRQRKLNVFRYTNPGDNYLSGGFTDKLIMNVDENTKIENIFAHRLRIVTGIDVADNANPDGAFGEQQDTGPGERVYEIHGTVSLPDAGAVLGNNALIARIKTWEDEAKENSSYPFGRFGIVPDNLGAYLILPTSTKGLEFLGTTWDFELETDNAIGFVMKFKQNKQ